MTTKNNSFKKGDTVNIKPEWQDEGDDSYTWIIVDVCGDERLEIMPVNIDLTIKPVFTVYTYMIDVVS